MQLMSKIYMLSNIQFPIGTGEEEKGKGSGYV